MAKKRSSETKKAWSFLAPAVIILFVVGIFPLLFSVYISLHSYEITKPYLGFPFIWFDNYKSVLTSSFYWDSVFKTFIFGVITLPIQLALGIGIALLLYRKTHFPRFQKLIRVLIIIPLMMTPAVVGLIARLIYNSQFGILNYFLGFVGIPKIPWLGQPTWAFMAICMMEIWQWTPFVALVSLASLNTVPEDLYEAAALETSGWWRLFRHIMLPWLLPGLTAVLILRTADILKVFDTIFVLTRGGPGVATELLSVYIQRVGFRVYNLGEACAMAFISLVVTIIISRLYIRFFYREIEL